MKTEKNKSKHKAMVIQNLQKVEEEKFPNLFTAFHQVEIAFAFFSISLETSA